MPQPSPRIPSDIAFTPAVKALQTLKGSRESYERMEALGGWQQEVTPELKSFLGQLDMFYLGTANAAGQPYIQYRGGPQGFLKVIDEKTLGFADFGGNRQYISLGNISENPKAFIFLMDYATSRRAKIWGRAIVVEDDSALIDQLADPTYPGKPERVITLKIDAWDGNCPQHIHQRVLHKVAEQQISTLQSKVNDLEAQLADLRPDNDRSN